MEKEQIINIITSMGFFLDVDEWDTPNKEWMRFELENRSLDERDLRFIWYRRDTHSENMREVANILFKAGQKFKLQQLQKLENL